MGGPAFNNLVFNLAEAVLLMQNLPDTSEVCRMQHLTREALHYIDSQNPILQALKIVAL